MLNAASPSPLPPLQSEFTHRGLPFRIERSGDLWTFIIDASSLGRGIVSGTLFRYRESAIEYARERIEGMRAERKASALRKARRSSLSR